MELTADLGPPDHRHVPDPPSHHKLRRRKSPAQLRRSERRKQEFLKQKNEVAENANEPEKQLAGKLGIAVEDVKVTAKVSDAICTDDVYDDISKDVTAEQDSDSRVCTVEGEFHASFPQLKFREYLEAWILV